MLWTLTTRLVVTTNINGNRPVTCGILSACFGAHSLPRHTVGQITPTSQHLSQHPPNHRQQSSQNEPHTHPSSFSSCSSTPDTVMFTAHCLVSATLCKG